MMILPVGKTMMILPTPSHSGGCDVNVPLWIILLILIPMGLSLCTMIAALFVPDEDRCLRATAILLGLSIVGMFAMFVVEILAMGM